MVHSDSFLPFRGQKKSAIARSFLLGFADGRQLLGRGSFGGGFERRGRSLAALLEIGAVEAFGLGQTLTNGGRLVVFLRRNDDANALVENVLNPTGEAGQDPSQEVAQRLERADHGVDDDAANALQPRPHGADEALDAVEEPLQEGHHAHVDALATVPEPVSAALDGVLGPLEDAELPVGFRLLLRRAVVAALDPQHRLLRRFDVCDQIGSVHFLQLFLRETFPFGCGVRDSAPPVHLYCQPEG